MGIHNIKTSPEKRGFDKTIIVGIILFILSIVLAISIAYGVEEILEILFDTRTGSPL